MTKRTDSKIPGLNVQWPWAEMIVSGKKTIETRGYPLPEKYRNRPLAIIETPGAAKKFRSRVAGIVVFTDCFRYDSEESFDADFPNHCVSRESSFHWGKRGRSQKWGWRIAYADQFQHTLPGNFRTGVIFSVHTSVPRSKIEAAYAASASLPVESEAKCELTR